jgi:hypothetical protein
MYRLNMVDCRIDVLDSSNDEHIEYHGDQVVPRLNDLFQRLTDGKFKDFSRWKRPITKVMRENIPSDSAFIAMKVLQNWDGTKIHLQNQVRVIPIDILILRSPHIHDAVLLFLWSLLLIQFFLMMQISMSELRSEMLSYMLYYQHNQRKMLPYGLEEYRQNI